VGGTPIIAGLNKRYIIQQMNDFKNGVKPATVMHQIAKGYSDEQIQVIAEYLSNQKP
jgi:cytochrome c553